MPAHTLHASIQLLASAPLVTSPHGQESAHHTREVTHCQRASLHPAPAATLCGGHAHAGHLTCHPARTLNVSAGVAGPKWILLPQKHHTSTAPSTTSTTQKTSAFRNPHTATPGNPLQPGELPRARFPPATCLKQRLAERSKQPLCAYNHPITPTAGDGGCMPAIARWCRTTQQSPCCTTISCSYMQRC